MCRISCYFGHDLGFLKHGRQVASGVKTFATSRDKSRPNRTEIAAVYTRDFKMQLARDKSGQKLHKKSPLSTGLKKKKQPVKLDFDSMLMLIMFILQH